MALEHRIEKILETRLVLNEKEVALVQRALQSAARKEKEFVVDLINDLGADSLDLVELFMFLEDELDIEISDEDAVKLKTVCDVYNYIADHC